MRNKVTSILLLGAALALATGCIGRLRVGPTQTDTETVELGGAESAHVDIKMGVGQVNIDGGASALLEADFTYNVKAWEPEVDYRVNDDVGRLTIQQPEAEGVLDIIPDDDIEYRWDLKLNDETPVDLEVELGVGDSDLDLKGLNLSDLELQIGVGEVEIDLTGDWERSFDVNIKGGVGTTKVHLPQNVGVRVDTQTGIGSLRVHGLIRNGNIYTNEAYEGADVRLDIDIQGGVGEIELDLGD
jgi:hypothetical protein